MREVVQIETCFNAFQADVHLRLYSLPTQIIAAQSINIISDSVDILAHANNLITLISNQPFDTRNIRLQLLEDFVDQFIGDFF